MERSTASGRPRREGGLRRKRPRAQTGSLLAVAGLAVLYVAVTAVLGGVRGLAWWDGVLGVVLGLFICSLPVRRFLDLLLYSRMERARYRSRREMGLSIAGNALVLLAGWLVIVIGTTRFTSATR